MNTFVLEIPVWVVGATVVLAAIIAGLMALRDWAFEKNLKEALGKMEVPEGITFKIGRMYTKGSYVFVDAEIYIKGSGKPPHKNGYVIDQGNKPSWCFVLEDLNGKYTIFDKVKSTRYS